jgi:hypothetical protein
VVEDVWDFDTNVGELTPVHQSDVFQWEFLTHTSGVYSDMDILFVQPMDEVYATLGEADVMFCSRDTTFAIGFLGSGGKGNRFFRDIRDEAVQQVTNEAYQSAGIKVVNKIVDAKRSKCSGGKSRSTSEILELAYPKYRVVDLPGNVVYPFVWQCAGAVFDPDFEELPSDTVGVHWYAGAKISQQLNGVLTDLNMDRYPCLFTQEAQRVLEL